MKETTPHGNRVKFDWISDYEAKHLVSHCVHAVRMADAKSLLQLETPDGKNAWYEFKIHHLDTAGFLSDVDLVWKALESDTTTDGSLLLSEWLRFALITASVNSVAARLPGSVLAALTLRGIWTPQQAVT